MHAWIPWPCFPMPPYWADTGSQYRISGAIRFWLFPAPWVLGYIAGQSAEPQCHSTTDYVSSSAALPPNYHIRSLPNQETFAVLSIACATSPSKLAAPHTAACMRRERPSSKKQSRCPPTPAPTPKFDAGVFKHLPSLGLVFNALRQMGEVFTHRASKLMHGRVLDLSCRDSVQSLTLPDRQVPADPPANQAEARTGGCQMHGLIIWSIEAK